MFCPVGKRVDLVMTDRQGIDAGPTARAAGAATAGNKETEPARQDLDG